MELVIDKEKLKVFYGSDFHSDFWNHGVKPFFDRVDVSKYDLFIFAGDVGEWCDDNAREIYTTILEAGKPIIMVPGNHEFYSGNYQLVMEELAEFAQLHPQFFFLERNYVDLPVQRVRIWGDTFWTDFGHDAAARSIARRCMNDYRKIFFQRTSGGVYLEPEDTVVLNDKARTALQKDYGDTPARWHFLVVTHHAPFPMSTPKQYRKPEYTDVAKLNKAYANDLYDWCINNNVYPDFWIHGHIHDRAHYEVDMDDHYCTVVSNPFGYPGEKNHDEISMHWLEISCNGGISKV